MSCIKSRGPGFDYAGRMGYQLKRREPVDRGLARIKAALIDDAIAFCAGSDVARAERVHEARKSIKRLRALVRITGVARDGFEEPYYRDAARALAGLREADAAFDVLSALLNDIGVDASCRSALYAGLATALDRDVSEARAIDAFSHARDLLSAAREMNARRPPGRGFRLLKPGLHRTLARVHRRFQQYRRHPAVPISHRLRKAVKYHRYQIELIEPCWTGPLLAYRQALDGWGECLGEAHDLAAVSACLEAMPVAGFSAERARLTVAIADRQRRLHAETLLHGARICAESEDAFLRRIERYFKTWRQRSKK